MQTELTDKIGGGKLRCVHERCVYLSNQKRDAKKTGRVADVGKLDTLPDNKCNRDHLHKRFIEWIINYHTESTDFETCRRKLDMADMLLSSVGDAAFLLPRIIPSIYHSSLGKQGRKMNAGDSRRWILTLVRQLEREDAGGVTLMERLEELKGLLIRLGISLETESGISKGARDGEDEDGGDDGAAEDRIEAFVGRLVSIVVATSSAGAPEPDSWASKIRNALQGEWEKTGSKNAATRKKAQEELDKLVCIREQAPSFVAISGSPFTGAMGTERSAGQTRDLALANILCIRRFMFGNADLLEGWELFSDSDGVYDYLKDADFPGLPTSLFPLLRYAGPLRPKNGDAEAFSGKKEECKQEIVAIFRAAPGI